MTDEQRLIDTNRMVYAYTVSDERKHGAALSLVERLWEGEAAATTLQNLCELRNVFAYTAVFHPFVPEGSEKISKARDYLVSQRILIRRSTDSNSGSLVKTVASRRWAVATQKASA